MLLVVADSSGSSPGRRGYKMAVGQDGALCGSIGGGVMEVNLVEQSRTLLGRISSAALASSPQSFLRLQVHKKDIPDSSGMICSGRQTVIFRLLGPENAATVDAIINSLRKSTRDFIRIDAAGLHVIRAEGVLPDEDFQFEKVSETEFIYVERLGYKNNLFIVGGGHCALALSELMSRMDFHIILFDDRPDLNTIAKNRFAHEIRIIEKYELIAEYIPPARDAYVVVMTLGYRSDGIVIRKLLGRDFKYFGVLGSRAKIVELKKCLRGEGFSAEMLRKIRAPIGVPINSHTPEEIAVSIAAEIISVKNSPKR